jgi:LDH2 family malate/lactate/ureidoglycolate dehydrogenase
MGWRMPSSHNAGDSFSSPAIEGSPSPAETAAQAPSSVRWFSHLELRELSLEILTAAGTPEDLGVVVADYLIDANLAGHDSHGVLRIPGYYKSLLEGDVIPAARAELVHRDRAIARVDGCWGWGQPAMHLATETAIQLAVDHGVSTVVVDRCYHIGRVAPYVEAVARAGMIGIAMSNAGPAVAPFGGRDRVLGTNPFAWAIPRGDGCEPLSFDIATAGIAEGKLRVARAAGHHVPPGYLVDSEGAPSQDPSDFFAGGSILPFGGHKGNGISILAQMLGRGLAGMDTTGFDGPRGANGPIILAIDVEPFLPLPQFSEEIRAQCDLIVRSRPGHGSNEVLLPGELELRTRRERLESGIPVHEATWNEITAVLDELGIVKGAT